MTRIKTVRKKGKLKPKEKGEPLPYKKLVKPPGSSRKQIAGIFKSWQKAPKFILKLKTDHTDMYLSESGELTPWRKEAKKFAYGFDNEEVKMKHWADKYQLPFITISI